MPPKAPSKRNVAYWFRTDLRLHDSPALLKALELKPAHFYPIWCWGPHYVYAQRVGANRWQFLLDSMNDVSERLTALNDKTKMFVLRGSPLTILPAIWKAWSITDIVWEKDDDMYTAERDRAVEELAKKAGVTVHIVLGHTIYDAAEVAAKNKGSCPRNYGAFLKVVEKLGPVPEPLPAPTSIPSPGPLDGLKDSRKEHDVEDWRARDINFESRETGTTEREQSYGDSIKGPNGDFAVPTMKEIGMVSTSIVRGGETRALEVFEEFMEDQLAVATFRKPKTSPAEWEPTATTRLSPHMKFGTLSCRKFYHRVFEINQKAKTHSAPPESLIGQLLWREFFHANQFNTPHYTRIRGNPVSKFIAWDLQTRYDDAGEVLDRADMEKVWQEEEPDALERFTAWKEGRTGYPWIDALMRQLNQEGWMHHLGRHSVACFLTRGHLYISWERGAEVFDQKLVDWDPALNAGNWMWLSASAFFSQYFRVYSPHYGQNFDKTGKLIRRFVPELAKYPDKYIYEPWKASAADQKKFGCVLGKDYPERIVDEQENRKVCLAKMKAAYAANIHGDDSRVLDGTAGDYVNSFLVKSEEDAPAKASAGTKRKASAASTSKAKASPGKRVKKEPKQTKLEFD